MVEHTVIFFLRCQQGGIHAIPLDGVADRTFQPAGCDLAFDKVILRSGLNGFQCHGFVVRISGYYNRQPRRFGPDQGNVGQSGAIRHANVEHDQIEIVGRQHRQGVLQVRRGSQVNREVAGLAQHFADDPGEARVVFNQQNLQTVLRHSSHRQAVKNWPDAPQSGADFTMTALLCSRKGFEVRL